MPDGDEPPSEGARVMRSCLIALLFAIAPVPQGGSEEVASVALTEGALLLFAG
jgi:hypothetical protein